MWGATFPVARLGVAAGADPILLVVLDLLLAASLMAAVAALTRTHRPSVRALAQSAALGALLIAGINLPLYWGLRGATGGTASIVYATAPIISLVVLGLLGGSIAFRRRQVAALVVGLGGVAVLGFATAGPVLVAGLAALAAFALGAACQGTGAVLIGRARPRGEDPWGLTFQFVGAAAASLVALPILSPAPAFPVTAATVGSVVFVGVLSLVVGYTLFFDLIQRVGAVRANQVTFLNPVVAVGVGVVVFGERFVPLELGALALVVLALALLQPDSESRSSTPAPPRDPRSEPVAPSKGP